MARRKKREQSRHDREFWTRLAASWKHSSQTLREFCEEHDIKESTFGLWRRRLASEESTAAEQPAEQATLLPVEVLGRLEEGSWFEIVLPGDRRVRVRSDFDEEALRRVVTCLEGLEC